MGTLALTDPVNGTVADASTIANNNAAIKTVVNGGIDPVNMNTQELATTQVTSDTTVSTSTATDLATFAAVTFQAAKYYAQISIPKLKSNTSTGSTVFRLQEGTTQVGSDVSIDSFAAAKGQCVFYMLPFTPTAASHTYKWTWNTGGTNTSTISATSLAAAQFNIVKA